MLPSNNIQSIIGATLYGRDKEKVGRVEKVLVDAVDGHPTWAVLHGGLFGRKNLFVPLEQATWEHDDVFVELDRDTIKNAPHPDADGGLSPEHEQELRAYFHDQDRDAGADADSADAQTGVPRDDTADSDARRDDSPQAPASAPATTSAAASAPPLPATVGHDVSRDDTEADGPKHAVETDAAHDEPDESVVLVQERLIVRTEQVPVARMNPDAVHDLNADASHADDEAGNDDTATTGRGADEHPDSDAGPGPGKIII
jgi:hypothetical protein